MHSFMHVELLDINYTIELSSKGTSEIKLQMGKYLKLSYDSRQNYK